MLFDDSKSNLFAHIYGISIITISYEARNQVPRILYLDDIITTTKSDAFVWKTGSFIDSGLTRMTRLLYLVTG